MEKCNEEKTVARLSELLALRCGFLPVVAMRLRTAALLHDIGKQRIATAIINKPGKLDPHEFEVIKTHTTMGADMLASIQGETGEMARNICRYHHEKRDGSGYWGVFTDTLPAYVPIVSISDIFVALINERPYKDAWTPDAALGYIYSQSGTRFAPALVKEFISLMRNDKRVPAIFEG